MSDSRLIEKKPDGGAPLSARFPTTRMCCDAVVLCAVCLFSGWISLGYHAGLMLSPLLPVVGTSLLGLALGGAYRAVPKDAFHRMLICSLRGFCIAAGLLFFVVPATLHADANGRFLFFYLFMAFFVINTMHPLMVASQQR